MARSMKTMDGNTAAAHASYAFTDVAAIYPITPSSVMAELSDKWAADGRNNIFGEQVKVVEMQSEAGAAGAVHGSLAAGALTTTFTASQGLLLMIPNMYKIAGEMLPCVINVSARAVASHALSIFGDHSDVYACRQTGFAMLCSTSPQEVMDLTPIAHLSAIKGRIPFLNFFDGFRTSHEVQKIEAWNYDELKKLADFDAIDAFRKNALNPNHPVLRGTAQNPDIFFQAREACNTYYDALPAVVEDYMNAVNKEIGTDYKLFNYYGAPDAENVVVAMGSVCDTIEETIDYLVAKGEKVGLIKVRLYRPFSIAHLVKAIPASVKKISVLDRTKEPGALGEPLFLDVVTALRDTDFANIPVSSVRYGLGSKDTTPGQIIAVFDNLKSGSTKKQATIGITDDVTNLSLAVTENPDTTPKGTTSCKFWGLGADGTVGANKNTIKIIGDHTDMYAQGYFAYDSKKSGGITVSHLRFGKSPIKSTYYISQADFVACHNPSYIDKYRMVEEVKPGGVFLLNCAWDSEALEQRLPGSVKRYIANNNIKFYTIDAVSIAKELGLGGRVNTILQSAFFKLSQVIDINDAVKFMKEAVVASYGKKGQNVVDQNHAAIDRGLGGIVEVKVPDAWKNAEGGLHVAKAEGSRKELVDFVNNILTPVNAQQGDLLPVSAFKDSPDGTFPQGSAAYEKRGIAVDVPCWITENCIQCNQCAYVCPHAVMRPVAMTDDELAKAPEGTKSAKFKPAVGDLNFSMSISVLDCTGCGVCANVCPINAKGNAKAIEMKPLDSQMEQQNAFAYAQGLPEKQEVLDKFAIGSVKGSQFRLPLLEYSGACAGCAEPSYARLVTQLFGERMYIANATGCSSIWGGSAPATPYTVGRNGFGPAWANSLFEDNAEYGYGMYLAQKAIRTSLVKKVESLGSSANGELKSAIDNYLGSLNDGVTNPSATQTLIEQLEKNPSDEANAILKDKEFLGKKSIWILGGDGWAYDIGFSGLDHVIASNEDVNILVFDTEVYSNTGGQSSKATPTGAVAQFAAAGKDVKKKDLAAIAMSYGYVYVAQIAMGANQNQCIKAFSEAESYNGPSIIIAYAPCINHGIKGGMTQAQAEMKRAVESGYWHLFRFDPRLALDGKNPFQLDSKAPTTDYKDFIKSETRYTTLIKSFPERADELFEKASETAKAKYDHLLKLVDLYAPKG